MPDRELCNDDLEKAYDAGLEAAAREVREQQANGARFDMLASRLDAQLAEAESKAIDALARYKFQMFGYWAAVWVHLNRLEGAKRPNPFKGLVLAARGVRS